MEKRRVSLDVLHFMVDLTCCAVGDSDKPTPRQAPSKGSPGASWSLPGNRSAVGTRTCRQNAQACDGGH
ncbi:MAG: hypothetical protein P4L33_19245 [Capsulimonadaceae bacterium]|nr:hypothetical protein [Capsulimonadaceae bacterium]